MVLKAVHRGKLQNNRMEDEKEKERKETQGNKGTDPAHYKAQIPLLAWHKGFPNPPLTIPSPSPLTFFRCPAAAFNFSLPPPSHSSQLCALKWTAAAAPSNHQQTGGSSPWSTSCSSSLPLTLSFCYLCSKQGTPRFLQWIGDTLKTMSLCTKNK